MHRCLPLLWIAALAAPAFAQDAPAKLDDETAEKPAAPVVPPAPEPTPQPKPKSDRAAPSFVDTRLNFTFTHENLLADLDESQVPNIPGPRFGRPNQLGTLFFDNYDTRFSGFETLSHAVLYTRYDDDEWEVEGALVLRVNDLSERKIELSDAGSYVRVAYWFDPTRKNPARISVTGFPTSSDRMRLGYSYRLSWGGSDEFPGDEAVPGVKVQYDDDRFYAFVGAKTVVLKDAVLDEPRAAQSFLAGAGADLTEMVRVEINGGFFNRGDNELQDVLGETVQMVGASAQVAIHDGMPVGSSIDYKLYRNDPERVVRLFGREVYPGGVSWMIAAEATVIGQTLKDPESPGSTVVQQGYAGDLNVRVKIDYTRLRLDLQYRDLAFILHTTPSLPAYSDFPAEYELSANQFAAFGVDHHLPALGLTVGGVFGTEKPAAFTTPKAFPGDLAGATGESTSVVRGPDELPTTLPAGEKVLRMYAFKLTSRLDFANNFATLLDIYYSYDPNRTRLRRDDAEDQFEYEFDEDNFHQLGFNFSLQARF